MATQSKSFLVWNEDDKKFIATEGSKVKVLVIPTNEELVIAQDTLAITA